MLARARATAWMMRYLYQRQVPLPEKLRFGPREFHENRLAQGHRGFSLFLELDGVVDTPRRARPSSAQTSDDRVAPIEYFLHDRLRRALHVGRLGSEDNFLRLEFFAHELGELLKHGRRVRLSVVDDANRFSFEGFQAGHKRTVFWIYCCSGIKEFDRRHGECLSVSTNFACWGRIYIERRFGLKAESEREHMRAGSLHTELSRWIEPLND